MHRHRNGPSNIHTLRRELLHFFLELDQRDTAIDSYRKVLSGVRPDVDTLERHGSNVFFAAPGAAVNLTAPRSPWPLRAWDQGAAVLRPAHSPWRRLTTGNATGLIESEPATGTGGFPVLPVLAIV